MLVRRLARSLLATTFITGGAGVLQDPEPHIKRAKALLVPLGAPEEYVPTITLADAGLKVAGGLALATGRLPRVAAVGLAASLVPTTLAGHRFWEQEDPEQRRNHRNHFMKNVALVGAMITVALDTGGRESLPHRAVRALPWTKG